MKLAGSAAQGKRPRSVFSYSVVSFLLGSQVQLSAKVLDGFLVLFSFARVIFEGIGGMIFILF